MVRVMALLEMALFLWLVSDASSSLGREGGGGLQEGRVEVRGTRRQFGGISESSQDSRGEGRHGRLGRGGTCTSTWKTCVQHPSYRKVEEKEPQVHIKHRRNNMYMYINPPIDRKEAL